MTTTKTAAPDTKVEEVKEVMPTAIKTKTRTISVANEAGQAAKHAEELPKAT